VRAPLLEAVRSITDDGMWLASLWGYVWNKCDAGTLSVSPVKGTFFVVVNGDKNRVLRFVVVSVLI
jgi:hypothetical protein